MAAGSISTGTNLAVKVTLRVSPVCLPVFLELDPRHFRLKVLHYVAHETVGPIYSGVYGYGSGNCRHHDYVGACP